MHTKIISVAKQLPSYTRETNDIIPYVKNWMSGQDNRFKRKVLKLFKGSGVKRRYSIMDVEEVFSKSSFEEKNNIYIHEATKLAWRQSIKNGGHLDILFLGYSKSCPLQSRR